MAGEVTYDDWGFGIWGAGAVTVTGAQMVSVGAHI